jgi:hypothetical protein
LTEILPWLPEWREFLRLIALPESDRVAQMILHKLSEDPTKAVFDPEVID